MHQPISEQSDVSLTQHIMACSTVDGGGDHSSYSAADYSAAGIVAYPVPTAKELFALLDEPGTPHHHHQDTALNNTKTLAAADPLAQPKRPVERLLQMSLHIALHEELPALLSSAMALPPDVFSSLSASARPSPRLNQTGGLSTLPLPRVILPWCTTTSS